VFVNNAIVKLILKVKSDSILFLKAQFVVLLT